MTVIGPDRPGLVQLVATCVADNGGNWLESRMCHLGGQFAGILRVEVSKDRAQSLLSALQSLEAEGLSIRVQTGEGPAPVGGRSVAIELVGQDRPGILRQISGVLATHRVNVEELASERTSTPMGGGTLFQARIAVKVPEKLEVAVLRKELERIASDLMIDLKVEP